MDDEPTTLRDRAQAAAVLAASSRDPSVANLLLQVSEELEEEACKAEVGIELPRNLRAIRKLAKRSLWIINY